jgi:hypothetical protein
MSPQQDIFNHAIQHFSAEQEEVRSAAAFAAGKHFRGFLRFLCMNKELRKHCYR